MTEKIPPDQLEETIATLGVDRRTADKMRAANQVPEPVAGDKPARRAGFGAPAQDTTPLPRGI